MLFPLDQLPSLPAAASFPPAAAAVLPSSLGASSAIASPPMSLSPIAPPMSQQTAAQHSRGRKRPHSDVAQPGRWTKEEKDLFLELREKYPGKWKQLADAWETRRLLNGGDRIRTKSETQFKTRNQSLERSKGGRNAKDDGGRKAKKQKTSHPE